MRQFIQKFSASFARDEKGVTLVEYGIAISLAVALGGGAFTVLRNDISGSLSTVGSMMP